MYYLVIVGILISAFLRNVQSQNAGEIGNQRKQRCHAIAGTCRGLKFSDCETKLQRCLSGVDRGNLDSSWPTSVFGYDTSGPPQDTSPPSPPVQKPDPPQPQQPREQQPPPQPRTPHEEQPRTPNNDNEAAGNTGNGNGGTQTLPSASGPTKSFTANSEPKKPDSIEQKPETKNDTKTVIPNANEKDTNSGDPINKNDADFGQHSGPETGVIVPVTVTIGCLIFVGAVILGAHRVIVRRQERVARERIEWEMERSFYPGHVA